MSHARVVGFVLTGLCKPFCGLYDAHVVDDALLVFERSVKGC